MDRTYSFEIESELTAAPQEVWRHATNMRGVNRELRPLVRMNYPRECEELTPASIVLGRRLFRSWILLFGFLPIDYDDLTFVEFEPGRRFLERSPTLTLRWWQHERRIEATPAGCRVTDRVAFCPRAAWLGPLFRRAVKTLFTLRHRNLRRLFAASEKS